MMYVVFNIDQKHHSIFDLVSQITWFVPMTRFYKYQKDQVFSFFHFTPHFLVTVHLCICILWTLCICILWTLNFESFTTICNLLFFLFGRIFDFEFDFTICDFAIRYRFYKSPWVKSFDFDYDFMIYDFVIFFRPKIKSRFWQPCSWLIAICGKKKKTSLFVRTKILFFLKYFSLLKFLCGLIACWL